jgi:hypothetical protein
MNPLAVRPRKTNVNFIEPITRQRSTGTGCPMLAKGPLQLSFVVWRFHNKKYPAHARQDSTNVICLPGIFCSSF